MKSALITGATSGIGEALARLLADKGFSLILTGRDQNKLQQLSQELSVEKIVKADLSVPEERKQLITILRAIIPDLVINNAGFGFYGDIITLSVKEQLAILEVNATAALEITLEAADALIHAHKKGIILNVSSVAGEYPCPGMSVYGASKAFLTSVSQALHEELDSKGVTVLVSCPGMVKTQFAQRAAKKDFIASKGAVLNTHFAAEQIWLQICKKQKKRIFDWRYRWIIRFAKYLIPTALIKKIIWNQIKKRI